MTIDDIIYRKLTELLEAISDRIEKNTLMNQEIIKQLFHSLEAHAKHIVELQTKLETTLARTIVTKPPPSAIGSCSQCGNWIYPNTKDHYGWFHTTKCNACNPYPWNPTEPPTATADYGLTTEKEKGFARLVWLLLKDRTGKLRMNPNDVPFNWQLRIEPDSDYPGRVWVSAELNKTPPEPLPDPQRCEVPPEGWSCSRERGHEGPCAARPIAPPAPPDPRECL